MTDREYIKELDKILDNGLTIDKLTILRQDGLYFAYTDEFQHDTDKSLFHVTIGEAVHRIVHEIIAARIKKSFG